MAQFSIYDRETLPGDKPTSVMSLGGERRSPVQMADTSNYIASEGRSIANALTGVGQRMAEAQDLTEYNNAQTRLIEKTGALKKMFDDPGFREANQDERTWNQIANDGHRGIEEYVTQGITSPKVKAAIGLQIARSRSDLDMDVTHKSRLVTVDKAVSSLDGVQRDATNSVINGGDDNKAKNDIARFRGTIDGMVKTGVISATEGVKRNEQFIHEAATGRVAALCITDPMAAVEWIKNTEMSMSLADKAHFTQTAWDSYKTQITWVNSLEDRSERKAKTLIEDSQKENSARAWAAFHMGKVFSAQDMATMLAHPDPTKRVKESDVNAMAALMRSGETVINDQATYLEMQRKLDARENISDDLNNAIISGKLNRQTSASFYTANRSIQQNEEGAPYNQPKYKAARGYLSQMFPPDPFRMDTQGDRKRQVDAYIDLERGVRGGRDPLEVFEEIYKNTFAAVKTEPIKVGDTLYPGGDRASLEKSKAELQAQLEAIIKKGSTRNGEEQGRLEQAINQIDQRLKKVQVLDNIGPQFQGLGRK